MSQVAGVMPCSAVGVEDSFTGLLITAAGMVPASYYLMASAFLVLAFLYNFLEFHIVGDIIRGLRGDPVALTFDPTSEIYRGVVSKCRIVHGRYLPTPWLSSPHFQTAFLNFFGRPPVVSYRRHLFSLRDGGTTALDWLLVTDVAGGSSMTNNAISKDDKTPIVVVVPGLTSDSCSPYLKHLAHGITKQGWNVVVSNHRGLGGISITSDCFYNAGWTEDLREIINYLHQEYPKAPIFAVGTSIGANILVKYLGEDGENTPIAGAASICSPWDLLIGDRFINRKLVQRLYDRALAIGLKGYAKLHQPILTRLANWEGIRKSCSVRDFDNYATCIVGKFETVDTYYRHCSSVSYVGKVTIPLLCISSLDDPLCTKEAIPWDECRANKNIVLATTTRGGHLGFFEGITARSLWWVGAVNEFLHVLYSSPYMHAQNKLPSTVLNAPPESSIDKSPYVNIMEDGMVAPMSKEVADTSSSSNSSVAVQREHNAETVVSANHDSNQRAEASTDEPQISYAKIMDDITAPIKRTMNQLSRQSGQSMWLLVYVAIVTSWPMVGSVLLTVFRKRLKGVLPAAWLRR